MDNSIRRYCSVFAADSSGHQHWLLSDGDVFADLGRIRTYIFSRSFTCQNSKLADSADVEDLPASFASYIYHVKSADNVIEEDVYALSKFMTQVAHGRVTTCGQIVVFSLSDFANGDDTLMKNIFGTKFLSAKKVQACEGSTIDAVLLKKTYKKVIVGDLSQDRKKTLARVCCALMHRQNVVLRLPVERDESGKLNYEQYSMDVLQQVLECLPQSDRCEVTFATVCGKEEVQRLTEFSLLLTDVSVAEPTNRARDNRVWVTLDEPITLTEKEESFLTWINEPLENREELGASPKLTSKKKAGQKYLPRRNLEEDAQTIEDFCNPEFRWWQEPDKTDKRIGSIKELTSILSKNPTLYVKPYRKQFLDNMDRLLVCAPGDYPISSIGVTPSVEANGKWNNSFMHLLFDLVLKDKSKDRYRIAEEDYPGDGWVYEQLDKFKSVLLERLCVQGNLKLPLPGCEDTVTKISKKIDSFKNL